MRAARVQQITNWATSGALPDRMVSVDLHGLTGAVRLSLVLHLGSADDRAAVIRALPPGVTWGEDWQEPTPEPEWITLPSTTGDAAPRTACARGIAWRDVPVILLSPATEEELLASRKAAQ